MSWRSLDGAMTKALLGGKSNREKPDGSGKARRQAVRRRMGMASPRRRQYAFGNGRGSHGDHPFHGSHRAGFGT